MVYQDCLTSGLTKNAQLCVPSQQKLQNLQAHLATWCDNFTEKTGFECKAQIEGPPRMAYLEIRVIKRNEAINLEKKLEGISLKSLELSKVEPYRAQDDGPSEAEAPPTGESSQTVQPYAVSGQSKRRLRQSFEGAGSSTSKIARSDE
jgi:hypothetical protein